MLRECQAVAMIPVSDLDRVRSFYVDRLGLRVAEERDDEILFECGGGTSFGVFVSQGRSSGSHTQMAFTCTDVEGEVAALRAAGVTLDSFDMPGVESRDGIYDLGHERGAWFHDPEGNVIAVVERTSAPMRA